MKGLITMTVGLVLMAPMLYTFMSTILQTWKDSIAELFDSVNFRCFRCNIASTFLTLSSLAIIGFIMFVIGYVLILVSL